MPVEAFPTRIRSTAHGISAATGKLGATAGSFGLLAYFNSFCTSTLDAQGQPLCSVGKTKQSQISEGVVSVMAICAGVSLGGMLMTALFVKETSGKELEEVDAGSKVLKALDKDKGAHHRYSDAEGVGGAEKKALGAARASAEASV
jgi:hypothetical protein